MDVDEWCEADLSTEVVAGLAACNSQDEEFVGEETRQCLSSECGGAVSNY